MKRIAALLAVVALALVAAVPVGATTPAQQLKAQKVKYAKLQGQLAKLKKADAATITGLQGQVTSLTAQVSKQASGGLAAILAGSPDDLWAAVNALWVAFPKEADGAYCGYDKTNSAITFGTSTDTSFSFSSNPCSTP